MTSAQRVIKAIAIGFAIFLIVLIFSSILFGLSMVGHIFGLYHDVSKELTVVLETDYAVSNLEIDVSTANLELVLGSRLMVSSTDSNVRAYIENGTLYVEDITAGSVERKYMYKGISENKFKWWLKLPKNANVTSVDLKNGLLQIAVEIKVPEEVDRVTYKIK